MLHFVFKKKFIIYLFLLNYAQVYVEVVVTEPANFFRMLVSKCWATQYNQPNNTNGLHHVLIQNG